ncbi:MAG TPA: SBBP repeat-containing protein [Bacteroidales bacterium]|nr:SBBP repeat-containing protein [Bacteroidales bacterium]
MVKIRIKSTRMSAKAVLVIFLGIYLRVFQLSAQNQKPWQWVKQLGGDSWDITAGITSDSEDNIYVAGSFFDTLYCDSKDVISRGSQDIFISEFDNNGNLKDLWRAGGSGVDIVSGICTLPDDNILLCGLLSDSASLGNLKVSGPGKKLFITKFSNAGVFLWVTDLSITNDASLSLSGTDDKGNVYVSGMFSGSLTSDEEVIKSKGKEDIFVARISSSGAVENIISFGSEERETVTSLAVNGSGDIILTGTYRKDITLGNVKLTAGGENIKSNAFLLKLDREFIPAWVKSAQGEEYCEISSAKFDREGNIYTSGSYSSAMHFADTIFLSTGYSDIFLLKYRQDGSAEWKRNLGSDYYDYVSGVSVDNLGGVVMSGSLGDTLMIDSLRLEPQYENTSAFILQFSSHGKAVWSDCITGSGRNFSEASTLDKSGNLYFTGSFRNEFKKGDERLLSFGDQDLFVAKYFNCIETTDEISGQRYFCPGSGTELSVRRIYSNVVWNDTITGKYSITASKPGTYSVKMLDKKGCIVTGKVDITQSDAPWFTLGRDTTISITDSLLLRAPEKFYVDRWQDYSIDKEFSARSIDGIAGEEEYWLMVRDSLNCSYTDTIKVAYTKGYGWFDPSNTQLTVYPNPARDRMWWSLITDVVCSFNLDLTDERGVEVHHELIDDYTSGTENEIYVGNLPSGIYYLRISGSSQKILKILRVVKQ